MTINESGGMSHYDINCNEWIDLKNPSSPNPRE